MKTFSGHIAAPGVFVGRVAITDAKKQERHDKSECGNSNEFEKFENALQKLKGELSHAGVELGNQDIMEAMSMILEDESYVGGIRREISDCHSSAEEAIEKQAERLAGELESSGSEYLKSRIDDIHGISQRLISILRGNNAPQLTAKSIIASMEISPVALSSFDAEMIGAMISDKGSPNSHASIIAGDLGIPYIYGAGDAISQMSDKQQVVVDGNEGTIIIEPDSETYDIAFARMQEWESSRAEAEPLEDSIEDVACRTKIFANIAGPEDIPKLIESGADGVGLFRSEFLFIGREEAPGEEEQFQAYAKVLEAMDGKEVIIRTMDLGSDKSADWLKLPEELNPALGLRGLRVSLEYQDLLRTQLRALLRASVKGNLKIMFPMIASEWEVDEVIEKVREAGEELDREGIDYRSPEFGIMIETPAAAMIADRLAEKVSFFSIGTNDLTQYTLALDREAEGMDRYFNPRHEAVLRLVEVAAESAHEKGVNIGICGQLAADKSVMKRFIEAGIDELSVPLSKVKDTRRSAAQFESDSRCIEPLDGGDINDGDGSFETGGMDIAAVADGKLIPMNEIPDSAFAEGVLGPCIGIMPDNGNVYSPCRGTVKTIAETKHAITIENQDGVQYLVHIGIDTVELKGSAFTLKTKEGVNVDQGELLAVADLEMIRERGYSPVIITVKL